MPNPVLSKLRRSMASSNSSRTIVDGEPSPTKELSPTPTHQSDLEKATQRIRDEAELNYKPRTLKFWLIISSNFVAMFLVFLDRTIIATAVPTITEEFHSLGDIGWYGSAYMLTSSASQLLFGRIYRFYDVKWTFLVSFAIFEIGSLICAVAKSSITFILGRAIAGFGGAGLFAGVMVIMIPLVPLRKRPMFQGLYGGVFGLSNALGPLIGGIFTTKVSWRWCFYINLPFGGFVFAAIIFLLHLPKKNPPRTTIWEHFVRLDPLGIVFLFPSIVTLLLSLEWGGSKYPWSNWRVILCLTLFAVLLVGFAITQVLFPKNATVAPHIICQRSILAGSLFQLCVAGCNLMIVYYMPLWFQTVLGVNAIKSGVYTLPLVLSLIVSSILSGFVTQRTGLYVPPMIVSASLMAIAQGLLTTLHVGISDSAWIGYQFMSGFGLGLSMQAAELAAQTVLPKEEIPQGIAIMVFMQQLGGAVFSSVGQNVLNQGLKQKLTGIPGIDPSALTGEGATNIVKNAPPEHRAQVLDGYNYAVTRIFFAGLGLALGGVVFACLMEWKSTKSPPPPSSSPEATTPTEQTEKQRSEDPNPSSESVASTTPLTRASTGAGAAAAPLKRYSTGKSRNSIFRQSMQWVRDGFYLIDFTYDNAGDIAGAKFRFYGN